jgi:nucleoside-diphosphate-sugar epimerase
VIGHRLVPKLIERGHEVVATIRDATRGDVLGDTGATVVSMDGLDAASVGEAVARAEPDVIVHEMSALKGADDLRKFDDEFALTNELRTSGTDHLLAAADAVGVPRVVVQSYTGWPSGSAVL